MGILRPRKVEDTTSGKFSKGSCCLDPLEPKGELYEDYIGDI